MLVAKNHIVGHHTGFEVCQISIRGVHFFAGDTVGDLNAISGRVDIRVRGAHVFVHGDAAEFADLQASLLAELGIGDHADGHHGQFAGNFCSRP